jgi:hypothetical protein
MQSEPGGWTTSRGRTTRDVPVYAPTVSKTSIGVSYGLTPRQIIAEDPPRWMTALENGDANSREKTMHPLWEEYVTLVLLKVFADRSR